MTVNYVTPFRVFKSFVEFYPKLGATIAFSTMAAAARTIPTQRCCDKRSASNCKRSGGCLAREQFKSSEAKPCTQIIGAKPPSEPQAAGRPPNISCRPWALAAAATCPNMNSTADPIAQSLHNHLNGFAEPCLMGLRIPDLSSQTRSSFGLMKRTCEM